MSNTLAVATYSGGLLRILSIRARPSFRSFFSCARLTRMSFARLRASIRWSNERTGACAWVLGETIERASLTSRQRASSGDFGGFVCAREHVVYAGNGDPRTLPDDLFANPPRSVRIGEEDRPERNVPRARRDEFDDVPSRGNAAHPDDREIGRAAARVNGCERDRLQRGAGEAAECSAERRPQRVR